MAIQKGSVYFREEPHPLARHHRGEKVRRLCTFCVTRRPSSDFGRAPRSSTSQLQFDFSNAIDSLPALVMQAIVSLGGQTPEGYRIQAVTLPWFTLIREIQRDPGSLNQIGWRKLEELVAGAYEQAGYDVVLTPPSADRGRDIIAVKHDVCSIRIIDQVKAYAPDRRVTANDVRALLGVLSSEQNTSKGIVTTTATFAPGISSDPTIKPFIPFRLELRDGEQLRQWLLDLAVL